MMQSEQRTACIDRRRNRADLGFPLSLALSSMGNPKSHSSLAIVAGEQKTLRSRGSRKWKGAGGSLNTSRSRSEQRCLDASRLFGHFPRVNGSRGRGQKESVKAARQGSRSTRMKNSKRTREPRPRCIAGKGKISFRLLHSRYVTWGAINWDGEKS